jgi:hypothetical protein
MRGVHPFPPLLAVLAATGTLVVAHGADPAPGAVEEYVAHRSSYEVRDDAAALAAELALLERVESEKPRAGREQERSELVRARLEATIEAALARMAGRPSMLRTGLAPERGSEAEERLARRIDRLSSSVSDLVPEEIAAARSDVAAEQALFESGPVAKALSGLEQALSSIHDVPRKPVRDYLRVLRAQACYAGSLEELVALAEGESRALGERMEALALSCGAPSASALVERLKEEGSREDNVSVAREEARRSTEFARTIFPVPEGIEATLSIDEGDPRARTPFGHYIPVGWRGKLGHYVVTAARGEDAGAISRRRESFRLMLRGVAAHEGIPGHHLHFAVAARSGDPLLVLPYEGATTEGWGLFVEGVLERAGYFDEPREARLTPLRMRRWRADRVILDAGLQTGTLTREQAIQRLQRDVGFDRTVAEDEVDRYQQRAGYYAGYLLGARTFEAAERRALERGGPDAARAVRNQILSLGPSAPLRAVRRIVKLD